MNMSADTTLWRGLPVIGKVLKFSSTHRPRSSNPIRPLFSTRKGAADAFDRLFKKFANSVLIVSYSSNSLPTQDEMVALMAKYKEHVEVIPVDYRYSFGNQGDAKTHRNSVQEYLFVGF